MQHYYPEFILDGNQKWLFNPILKRRFKNLPEERIRLQWVDYLLENKLWQRSRIGFETPVKSADPESVLRADLVLYDQEFRPEILIECKAESIALTEATAEQAARYNRELGARKIILTNGYQHQMFELDQEGAKPTTSVFPFRETEPSSRTADYWQRRGFSGDRVPGGPGSWLEPLYLCFSKGCNDGGEIRYLHFSGTILPVPMDHYYRIVPLAAHEKIAWTLTGFPETDTYALFVLNIRGKNRALGIIKLSELFSGDSCYFEVLSDGSQESKVLDTADIDFLKRGEPSLLPKFIRKFFD